MLIKDWYKNNTTIFSEFMVASVNNFCDNSDTPLWLTPKWLQEINTNISLRYASRELIFDTAEELNNICTLVFKLNNEKYKHLLALFLAEYNPIHNYDKTIREELTKSGTEKETETPTGTETATFNKGAETNTNTGATTTFDTSTFFDTNKDTEVKGTYTDSTTTSFTNRKTEKELTFTNRKDTRQYTEFGNIGVTTTQQMAESEINYADKIKLLEIITLDLVREIAYMC